MKGHRGMTVYAAKVEASRRANLDPRLPERKEEGSMDNIKRMLKFYELEAEHARAVINECLEDH